MSLHKESVMHGMLKSMVLALLLGLSAQAALAESDPVRVNINQATAQELAAAMSGVGEARAQAIVRHREANGAFASVEDLVQVSGVGRGTLEANRDRITID
jgi:competence protein ComEA